MLHGRSLLRSASFDKPKENRGTHFNFSQGLMYPGELHHRWLAPFTLALSLPLKGETTADCGEVTRS